MHLNIHERIASHQNKGSVLYALPWDIQSVVTLKGSFFSYPQFESGEELSQDLAVALLDKGTKTHSKIEIAESLEDRGASIRFESAGVKIRFEAKCLVGDLPEVGAILKEQLNNPAFDETEFSNLKARIQGNLQRMKSDTGTLASNEISRQIYSPGHPGYAIPIDQIESDLNAISLETIRDFHASRFGKSDMKLALVGDLSDLDPNVLLRDLSEGWKAGPDVNQSFSLNAANDQPISTHREVAHRQNLDVRLGHGINLLKTDPDYLPLFVATFVLGGNFSSHLMSTIRDRDGLTYGIRSALSGISSKYPGMWGTSVTLSQENLERGIEAVRSEIKVFLDRGVSSSELEERKNTLTGSYQVQLSTTSGVASSILSNAENEYPLSRIDTYPEEIEAIQLDQVNDAMSRHMKLKELHVVSAGSKVA